tara:strand:+ start:1394 stop:1777 length:384 start_codon:yes stop_codon:yes gene_type:complete
MGYRSDVTIVMYPKRKEDFAALKLYVDETFPDKFEVHEDNNRIGGFRYLLLEIDSIKWYEGYEEVDVYTRAFSTWDTMFRDEAEPDDEPLFHYEFVRLGEDYEDIVYDRSVDSDMILNIERRAYVSI